MTEIPNNVPDSLVQDFWTAMWDSAGPGIPAEVCEDDIRAGLAAVLDALKGLARVELNREVESLQSAWRGQDAPTAPAQPAAPATRDTETTGGAASPTDDLSALRDRITQTLMQWYVTRTVVCEHTQLIEFGPAADAVMDVVRPELEMVTLRWRTAMGAAEALRDRAEQAEREAREYRAANTRLQELNVMRTERAEQAEAALNRARTCLDEAEARCKNPAIASYGPLPVIATATIRTALDPDVGA